MIEIKKPDGSVLEVLALNTLAGADLCRVHWSQADLRSVDLHLADLWHANLGCANLSETNLSHSNLRGANLRAANLEGSNLTHADLQDANLIWANLSGADLTGADLTNAKLGATLYDDATCWPDGYSPEEHGAQRWGSPQRIPRSPLLWPYLDEHNVR